MIHLNPNDDRENTIENLRELVEYAYHDMFVKYHEKEYILYSDHGGASIETPTGEYIKYEKFDELIKAPVFEGKSLKEIIGEIDATY